jgi:small subunit ribosomal protein S2
MPTILSPTRRRPGKSVLFVGTKKQARESIYEEANRAEMYYVHNRWLGGMLTNFQTIKKSVDRLNYLNTIENDGSIDLFPKKERLKLGKERAKLDSTLGGIRSMTKLPGAIFIIDPKNEAIAVREGRRLGIPIVAIVDTNCDPDESIMSFPEMTTPFGPFDWSPRKWPMPASRERPIQRAPAGRSRQG